MNEWAFDGDHKNLNQSRAQSSRDTTPPHHPKCWSGAANPVPKCRRRKRKGGVSWVVEVQRPAAPERNAGCSTAAVWDVMPHQELWTSTTRLSFGEPLQGEEFGMPRAMGHHHQAFQPLFEQRKTSEHSTAPALQFRRRVLTSKDVTSSRPSDPFSIAHAAPQKHHSCAIALPGSFKWPVAIPTTVFGIILSSAPGIVAASGNAAKMDLGHPLMFIIISPGKSFSATGPTRKES